MAAVAAAWAYGSVWPQVREQLCDPAKSHERLVSPYDLARRRGVCVKRIRIKFAPGHKRDHTISAH
jgi:hypothetical protein